jgi:hypothetical protein
MLEGRRRPILAVLRNIVTLCHSFTVISNGVLIKERFSKQEE